MNNLPTLTEYLHFSHGNVIMCHDGSFYLINKQSSRRYKILSTLLYILLYITVALMLWSTQWINISIDLILLDVLRHRISKRIEYNHCRFERIDESNEEYEDSIETLQSRTLGVRIGLKVVIGFLIVLCIALSFTALSVRSLFEEPHISDMRLSFTVGGSEKEIEFSNCEDRSEIVILNSNVSSIYMRAYLSGKPVLYEFKLNGRILSDIHCSKSLTAIWDDEIFRQYCRGSFDVNNLPNNSVLEISSGSFSRQWIIKTSEAAL